MDIDINLLRNLVTVSAFIAFLAVVWWAYAPSRRGHFEAQGRNILEQGDS